jgi:hypothetical protein
MLITIARNPPQPAPLYQYIIAPTSQCSIFPALSLEVLHLLCQGKEHALSHFARIISRLICGIRLLAHVS